MRAIDADELMEQYNLKDATKYGNKDAEQQNHSYSTMYLYEIADMIEDAPTIEAVPVENIKRIVERLGEMKMRYFLTIANSGSANLDSVYEEVGNCIDRAIEIVKEEGMK